MREGFNGGKLARKLALSGLPLKYIQSAVRELSEHWQDLKEEGLEQGLSLPEAEAAATRRIGETETLARSITEKLRESTWAGRHAIFTFCLLPLLAVVAWWAVFTYSAGWATGAIQWSDNKALPEPNWPLLIGLLNWCKIGAAAVLPLLFCWLSVRSFCGYQGALLACIVFSLHNGMHFVRLTPPGASNKGGFEMGYSVHSSFLLYDIPGFALPFLTFMLVLFVSLKLKTKLLKPYL